MRALLAGDVGTRSSTREVNRQIRWMGDQALADLEPETRDAVISIISHVWFSTLTSWAVGRTDFDVVTSELTRAVHVLVDPYE